MGKRYWKLMERDISHDRTEVIGYYKTPEYDYMWDYIDEFTGLAREYLKAEKNITPDYIKLNGINENERFIIDYGFWDVFLYVVPCSKEEAKSHLKKLKKKGKTLEAQEREETPERGRRITAIFTNNIKDYPDADAFRHYSFLDEIGVELGDLIVVDTVNGPAIAMVVSMESDYSGSYIRPVLAKIPNYNGCEEWKKTVAKFSETEKAVAPRDFEWTPYDPLNGME